MTDARKVTQATVLSRVNMAMQKTAMRFANLSCFVKGIGWFASATAFRDGVGDMKFIFEHFP
jgi:hypothetical protein